MYLLWWHLPFSGQRLTDGDFCTKKVPRFVSPNNAKQFVFSPKLTSNFPLISESLFFCKKSEMFDFRKMAAWWGHVLDRLCHRTHRPVRSGWMAFVVGHPQRLWHVMTFRMKGRYMMIYDDIAKWLKEWKHLNLGVGLISENSWPPNPGFEIHEILLEQVQARNFRYLWPQRENSDVHKPAVNLSTYIYIKYMIIWKITEKCMEVVFRYLRYQWFWPCFLWYPDIDLQTGNFDTFGLFDIHEWWTPGRPKAYIISNVGHSEG